MTHPCTTCGVCCASFRVDFSVMETQTQGGSVPDGLALADRVACGIYEWRPSPCREFEAGSDACERARLRHGLAPLTDSV